MANTMLSLPNLADAHKINMLTSDNIIVIIIITLYVASWLANLRKELAAIGEFA